MTRFYTRYRYVTYIIRKLRFWSFIWVKLDFCRSISSWDIIDNVRKSFFKFCKNSAKLTGIFYENFRYIRKFSKNWVDRKMLKTKYIFIWILGGVYFITFFDLATFLLIYFFYEVRPKKCQSTFFNKSLIIKMFDNLKSKVYRANQMDLIVSSNLKLINKNVLKNFSIKKIDFRRLEI